MKEKNGTLKKFMVKITLLTALGTLLFGLLFHHFAAGALLSLAITCGTVCYHLGIRLLLGFCFDSVFHNKMNYKAKWFQPKSFEAKLYKGLRVRKWKGNLPTFSPETFDPKIHTWEEIAAATCQSEVIHEINILLSFLPLLASLKWDSFGVFFVTSLAAALFDSVFVIIQRYNRPRILKLVKRLL